MSKVGVMNLVYNFNEVVLFEGYVLKSMKNRNLKINDDWKTPQDLYNSLNKEFHFDFDPCPFKHNINSWNGLEIDWGNSNFVNPPYSRKLKENFIRKAYQEYLKHKIVVMLLPVSTSTKIFHEIIYPNCEIRFLKGRVKFEGINSYGEVVTNKSGMFDSMICIFKPEISSKAP